MAALSAILGSSIAPGVRGAITKWYIEILPGVLVGSVSARVRELLWNELSQSIEISGEGYAVLVASAPTEQGFSLQQIGNHGYRIEDFLGLSLVTRERKRMTPEIVELIE